MGDASDILKEYKKTLKHAAFDDPFALWFFRPVAFVFVRFFYRTKITPNQVSFLGIFMSLVSGVLLAFGTTLSFRIAGAIFFFATVMDYVDGMLARITDRGTILGKLIDGVGDYVSAIAIYIGMGIGFGRGILHFDLVPVSFWWVLALAAVSHIAHSTLVDYHRVEFMAHGLGKSQSTEEEREKYAAELRRLNEQKGKLFEKVLIRLYLIYSKLQKPSTGEKKSYDGQVYYEANKRIFSRWLWIGPSEHVFFLILSLLFVQPLIYLAYTIVVANILLAFLLLFQRDIDRKLSRKESV